MFSGNEQASKRQLEPSPLQMPQSSIVPLQVGSVEESLDEDPQAVKINKPSIKVKNNLICILYQLLLSLMEWTSNPKFFQPRILILNVLKF